MNFQRLFLKSLTVSFPYILILTALAGFWVAFEISGIDYALKSLIFIIPIVLASVVLLIMPQNHSLTISLPHISIARPGFLNLLLLTVLLFIISIITLVYFPVRTWAYFVLISLISGLIFLQVLSQRPKWTDSLILAEIVLISLNLIWGTVLKYPLYFGFTDILSHLSGIETVVQTGQTAGLDTYMYYPLFHIYNAIGVEITGLSLKGALFIFMGLAWEVGIVFAYLIFLKISNARRFSLIAVLLFALSTQLIFYGMYTITRSLEFVLLLCWLYLILDAGNLKYVFLSLIMMFAVIVTHHTTIAFFIPILLVIYIAQKIFASGKVRKTEITLSPILLLSLGFLAYMFYIASGFTSEVLARQLRGMLVMSPMSDVIEHQTQYSYILGNIYDALTLFFSLIGIAMSLSLYKRGHKCQGIVVAGVAGLVLLIFYFGNITTIIPNSDILLLYRLPVMVSPLVIIMATCGLVSFLNLGRNGVHRRGIKAYSGFLVMLPVILLTFFSQVYASNASDISYVRQTSDIGSAYFTNSELAAFSFVKQQSNPKATLYGDYETYRNDYSLDIETFSTRRIITGGDLSYIKEGYLILRQGELENSSGLNFSSDGGEELVYRYHMLAPGSEENILKNLMAKDRVYSSGDTQLFIINNGTGAD